MNPRATHTRRRVVICCWILTPKNFYRIFREGERCGFQEFTAMTEKDEFQSKGGKFLVSVVES